MSDNLSILESILLLTREMLRSAKASQWDKVEVQEGRRQRLVRELNVGGAADGKNNEDVVAKLEETARINGQILALGEKAKVELSKAVDEVQRGNKANRAYSSVG